MYMCGKISVNLCVCVCMWPRGHMNGSHDVIGTFANHSIHMAACIQTSS